MAAIFDQINPDQWYVSVSMLNRFVDPLNICLDANLICLGAMVSKLQPSKYFLDFGRRPFWKVCKNHVSHARIPWGFSGVDTWTIRNSKLLELVCLQFCLSSPYIWAILTRLVSQQTPKRHKLGLRNSLRSTTGIKSSLTCSWLFAEPASLPGPILYLAPPVQMVRLKSRATWLFVQQLVLANYKENTNTSPNWLLCAGNHRPRKTFTKSQ